ncbi:polysaccharide hydrolase-invasin repeat family [Chlamydia felis Fe/C-56]|uniref:Polysaccharide hydrolase-invasin repeat family n=1 Tax=Chlamydia felis (strain Fe/C-56) TaxID=264202 RepID=Q254P1_CHLFF|nr:NlpC/P60 family protein [Chlamydia felis]BAE81247.1 polysaccharide hydrolase-invasin repeat family [Chlamydia felis Fe/C-56]
MKHYQLYAPVSDLSSIHGDLETQLLFGERLLSGKDAHYAYSQLVYNGDFWRPYPVKNISSEASFFHLLQHISPNAAVKSFDAFLEPWHIPLPYGTPLTIDSRGKVFLPEEVRKGIRFPLDKEEPFCKLTHVRFLNTPLSMDLLLKESENFLDIPYVWGGRCVHRSLIDCGLDCSGFINILFQAHGLSIPRNARDQYKDCDLVDSFGSLPPGGFVFLQNDQGLRISHVMLKKSSTCLIHAAQTLGKIVLFSLGRDIVFSKNSFRAQNAQGKAFFGVPRKRKVFF